MQTYQVAVVVLIIHQILITDLQGYLQQLEGRINKQILGVKGLTTTKPINLILSGLELFFNTNQQLEMMLFSRIFSCTYHKTFPPSHKQVALASRGMTIPCILHSIFHTFYNLLTKRIPLIIKSFFKMVIIDFNLLTKCTPWG